MTSLDRPVVPDVGIMTATSSGSTSAGPVPSPVAANSRLTSTHLGGARTPADTPSAPARSAAAAISSVSETTRAGVTWPEETGELGDGAGRIDRHLDGAHLHEGQPGQQVVGGVAGGDEDPVPRPTPAARNQAAAPSMRVEGLTVGEAAAVGGEQPRLVRDLLHRPAEEPGDRPLHQVSSGPGGVSRQTLPVGGSRPGTLHDAARWVPLAGPGHYRGGCIRGPPDAAEEGP